MSLFNNYMIYIKLYFAITPTTKASLSGSRAEYQLQPCRSCHVIMSPDASGRRGANAIFTGPTRPEVVLRQRGRVLSRIGWSPSGPIQWLRPRRFEHRRLR